MAAVFEPLIDFLAKRPAFFAKLFECLGTELTDDFSYLNGQWFIDLLQFGPAAHHQIPNGDCHFAGDRCDDQVPLAFASQQFPAPLGQGSVGATHDRLRALDQEPAQLLVAVSADTSVPTSIATVVKGRV